MSSTFTTTRASTFNGEGDFAEQKSFNIVVDVLPGEHPFLLGFPTLKRMSGQISFDENTLTLKKRAKSQCSG
jgi:hypothetical protein